MQRFLVIGCGGAGKTTVARQIAARTGLPLVHLDQLYWHPGWIPTPNAEWDRQVQALIGQEAWVMDGNYGRTLPQRLAAADTVVFLDLPRLVCSWRIIKRQLQHWGRSRADVAPGCPERLTLEFLVWIWTYRERRRPDIVRRLGEVRDAKQVFILTHAADVRRFIASLAPPPRVPPRHPVTREG